MSLAPSQKDKSEGASAPAAPAGVGVRVPLYVWPLTKHFSMLFQHAFSASGRRIWNQVFVVSQRLHNQSVKLLLYKVWQQNL